MGRDDWGDHDANEDADFAKDVERMGIDKASEKRQREREFERLAELERRGLYKPWKPSEETDPC